MTVAASASLVTFQGNGSTGPFSFNFMFYADSQIVVTLTDPVMGASVLVENTGYTLTGANNVNGGAVTLTTALAVGQALTVQRVLPLTQPVSLPDFGAFFAQTHEREFDTLTMMIQQVNDQVQRAIRLPLASVSNATLPSPTPNTVTGFDASGNLGLFPYNPLFTSTVANPPWVDARGYGSLAAAVAAIGSTKTTLLVASAQTVSANLVIPATLTLEVANGGVITVNGGVTLAVTGALVVGLYQIFAGAGFVTGLKEARPDWWGAHGDNATLPAINDAAFAAMMASAVPAYGVYNNAASLGNYPEIILEGCYKVSQTWDISYRNDLTVTFRSAYLSYWGAADGTVVEAKCSSKMRTKDITILGNSLAGIFWHQSGDGTTNGVSTKNTYTGLGNSYSNVFDNMKFFDQYPTSLQVMFDTTPYAADTVQSWYYSMDDSAFMNPWFTTAGAHGFAFAFGSSENVLHHPIINTPNGIRMEMGATIKAFNPVFTLSANDLGAIFVRPDPWAAGNGGCGNVELHSPYLEGTTAPLFSLDPSIAIGRVQGLNIYGGLLAQKTGATNLIYIPAGVTGNINIVQARTQVAYGRKIYAPSCTLNLDSPSSGTSADDFGIDVSSIGYASIKKTGSMGAINGQTGDGTVSLTVGTTDAQYSGNFLLLDDALDAACATQQHVTIYLATNQTINRVHRITGDIQIMSSNGSTLTFSAAVSVFGVLTINSTNVSATMTRPILNKGGNIFINTLTATVTGGNYLIQHLKGDTQFSMITVAGGGTILDGTYLYAVGTVAHKGNTVSSGAETNYVTGGSASMIVDKQ
jgi:hypothetical protein